MLQNQKFMFKMKNSWRIRSYITAIRSQAFRYLFCIRFSIYEPQGCRQSIPSSRSK